jgi:hypothetical protein
MKTKKHRNTFFFLLFSLQIQLLQIVAPSFISQNAIVKQLTKVTMYR